MCSVSSFQSEVFRFLSEVLGLVGVMHLGNCVKIVPRPTVREFIFLPASLQQDLGPRTSDRGPRTSDLAPKTGRVGKLKNPAQFRYV